MNSAMDAESFDAPWPGVPVRRLAPLYGSLPSAPAFDLAAAALLLREDPGPRSIACLSRTEEGEYGLARFARSCPR